MTTGNEGAPPQSRRAPTQWSGILRQLGPSLIISAVIVGPGGFQSNAYLPLVPEIQNPPDRGAALWVFEMPAPGAAKVAR